MVPSRHGGVPFKGEYDEGIISDRKKDPCKWEKMAVDNKVNSKFRIYIGLNYFMNLV